jgi:hypothetical protein
MAFSVGLGGATTGSADPEQTVPPAPERPGIAASAVTACTQFAGALRVSSAYYNRFARSIAGDGAEVDYHDPKIMSENEDGRTALRKAATQALIASGTQGLQPEIADPMRTWSLRATKLLIAMGLRLDGDTLNDAATELNNDATEVQMACANAGARTLVRAPKTNRDTQPATESSSQRHQAPQ